MSTENALLTILVEKIQSDSLVLPTLPEIAIKIREAADDPDVNLLAMADVIAQDPALSARMVKVANSAFMGRSVKVETLNQNLGFFRLPAFPLTLQSPISYCLYH